MTDEAKQTAVVNVEGALAAGVAKPTEPQPDLGRVRMPNPGSFRYPMGEALPRRAMTAAAWKAKRWQLGAGLTWLDQSAANRPDRSDSTCVKYMVTHIMMLTPIVRRDALVLNTGAYEWMQQNDFWPGEEPTYYGTSVDAAMQWGKKIGVIGEYRWPRNMDEALGRLCIPAKEGGGPLGIGIDWYSSFDTPDENGVVKLGGYLRGGHALTAIAHRPPTAKKPRLIGLGNSHDGNHVLWMEDTLFEWIVFSQGGDCVGVTELPK